MSDIGNAQQDEDAQRAVQQAAEELASRLKDLADTFASTTKPGRVAYGSGRVGQYLRRQSPAGYVLDPYSLRVLLPDGRLWSYSRSESNRFPTGRFFDARADYPEFAGGRSFPGGREFAFLGAVVNKYTFGWAAPDPDEGESDAGGLRAIYGEGRDVRYVAAEDALSAIAQSAASYND